MAKIRLVDIAAEAGVSVSTVSKALRNSTEIPKITQNHVIATAEKLGYYPNLTARSLRLGHTNLLGVFIPDNNNPYYSAILKGIELKARTLGFTIIITNTQEDSKLESESINKFISLSVDGILAVPVNLNNYVDVDIPLTFLSRYPAGHSVSFPSSCVPKMNSNFVISDDFAGQYLATKHLIDCGIKLPYFFLDTLSNKTVAGMKTQLRLAGYKMALEESHIEFDESKIISNIRDNEISYNTTRDLCKSFNKPEGILLNNDSIGIGVLRAAVDNDILVPDDLQIVGYDDIAYSKHLCPPLTTVHSAKQSIGEHGVIQLVDIINSKMESSTELHTVFEPYLVVRKSTKPLF